MKKITKLFIALAMVMSLVGCSSNKEEKNPSSSTNNTTSQGQASNSSSNKNDNNTTAPQGQTSNSSTNMNDNNSSSNGPIDTAPEGQTLGDPFEDFYDRVFTNSNSIDELRVFNDNTIEAVSDDFYLYGIFVGKTDNGNPIIYSNEEYFYVIYDGSTGLYHLCSFDEYVDFSIASFDTKVNYTGEEGPMIGLDGNGDITGTYQCDDSYLVIGPQSRFFFVDQGYDERYIHSGTFGVVGYNTYPILEMQDSTGEVYHFEYDENNPDEPWVLKNEYQFWPMSWATPNAFLY